MVWGFDEAPEDIWMTHDNCILDIEKGDVISSEFNPLPKFCFLKT